MSENVEQIPRDTNWEHLSDQLELLNTYLLREVSSRTSNNGQSHLDQLQGLVLSEPEIVAILTTGGTESFSFAGAEELEQRQKALEYRIWQENLAGNLRSSAQLRQLIDLFQLTRLEEQCVVLCLAGEIDPRYAKVFAFLQDDVTRQQPSIDLALRLFCAGGQARITARSIFSPNAPLLRNRILHLSEPAGKTSALPHICLKLDDRIAAFLLQTPQLEECLTDWVDCVTPSSSLKSTAVPSDIRDQTLSLVQRCFAGGAAAIRPLIHLYGRQGSGRRALATEASQQIGLPLLVADVRRMPTDSISGVEALWRLGRESLLLPAAVLVEGFDDLLVEGRTRELAALLDAIYNFSPLTFLSGIQPWNAQNPRQLFLSLECRIPDSTTRMQFWKKHLQDCAMELEPDDLVELSSKFNFTEGQIVQTVDAARSQAYWESPGPMELTAPLLSRAGRRVATPSLGGLARKIDPFHAWSDIVLPDTQLRQLREIVAHVKRAQVVFEKWGFAKTFSYGRGITALFEGQSGTGKTMAAGILGGALGLDLYKIDLSSVVSKYIGETEKNLSRIFAEAQDTSAILFFDEADALFGKRSEVKDAHDRYANIETAYLLQRMEEYSGIVILATNMKQNVDEAFVRRMRFIVHFPFPNDSDRERIWEKAIPADAPLGEDVNLHWLARKLKVTGGNIKNISLRAAFLAAERQEVIGMECLIEAAKREIEKIGRLSALTDFSVREPLAETFEVAEVA